MYILFKLTFYDTWTAEVCGWVGVFTYIVTYTFYLGGGGLDWTYLVAWCGSDVRRGRVWSGDLAGRETLARGTGSESLEG